jgi:hypothetical protein
LVENLTYTNEDPTPFLELDIFRAIPHVFAASESGDKKEMCEKMVNIIAQMA